ncbi:hypothetical protein DMC30DRAFT_245901 [Rhodotorula diobovata]|uniref:Uncharacterized protein n=1 Tax=Rhodotorula diobovata TaxID=5288 RepID=A0A5C5FUJ3_9BASI|nr:hypothetical protein DMC30DRAFT_245901 [Rhodotorula diobovata]
MRPPLPCRSALNLSASPPRPPLEAVDAAHDAHPPCVHRHRRLPPRAHPHGPRVVRTPVTHARARADSGHAVTNVQSSQFPSRTPLLRARHPRGQRGARCDAGALEPPGPTFMRQVSRHGVDLRIRQLCLHTWGADKASLVLSHPATFSKLERLDLGSIGRGALDRLSRLPPTLTRLRDLSIFDRMPVSAFDKFAGHLQGQLVRLALPLCDALEGMSSASMSSLTHPCLRRPSGKAETRYNISMAAGVDFLRSARSLLSLVSLQFAGGSPIARASKEGQVRTLT